MPGLADADAILGLSPKVSKIAETPSPSLDFSEADAILGLGEAHPTYDTELTPEEETGFTSWKSQFAPDDSGADYDFRGAFKAGLAPGADGHWPDTYKKPNHPTFSNESIYAKLQPQLAGSWNQDTYLPPAPETDFRALDQATGGKAAQAILARRKADLDANPDVTDADAERILGQFQPEPTEDSELIQQAVTEAVNDPEFSPEAYVLANPDDPAARDLARQVWKQRKARSSGEKVKSALGNMETYKGAAKGLWNFASGLVQSVPHAARQAFAAREAESPEAQRLSAETILAGQQAGLNFEDLKAQIYGGASGDQITNGLAQAFMSGPDGQMDEEAIARYEDHISEYLANSILSAKELPSAHRGFNKDESLNRFVSAFTKLRKGEELTDEERDEVDQLVYSANQKNGPEWMNDWRDRKEFDFDVDQFESHQKIQQGIPLDEGIIADSLSARNKLQGEPDYKPSEMFGPESLQAMGAAPVNPETVQALSTVPDVVNLATLRMPFLIPGARKIGGAAVEAAGRVGQLASAVPGGKLALSGAAGGALLSLGQGNPELAGGIALAAAGAYGLRKIGQMSRVMAEFGRAARTGGKEAAKATTELAQARLTGQSAKKAWLQNLVGNTAVDMASMVPGMAPLNAITAGGLPGGREFDLERFVTSEVGAPLFGLLSAGNGIKPQLVQAIRPQLRTQGQQAMAKNTTALGKQSQKFISSLPVQHQDAIYEMAALFEGVDAKSEKGEAQQSNVYVLSQADYQKVQRDLGIPQGGRGFAMKDGKVYINGQHQSAVQAGELTHTTGHELGGHQAMNILRAMTSKGGNLFEGLMTEARKELGKTKDGKWTPSPEFQRFVDTYNSKLPDGARQLDASSPEAMEEFISETAGQAIAARGTADLVMPEGIRDKLQKASGRFFGRLFGEDTRKTGTSTHFNREESGAVTAAYLDAMRQIADLRFRPETSEVRADPGSMPETPVETPTPVTPEPAAGVPAGATDPYVDLGIDQAIVDATRDHWIAPEGLEPTSQRANSRKGIPGKSADKIAEERAAEFDAAAKAYFDSLRESGFQAPKSPLELEQAIIEHSLSTGPQPTKAAAPTSLAEMAPEPQIQPETATGLAAMDAPQAPPEAPARENAPAPTPELEKGLETLPKVGIEEVKQRVQRAKVKAIEATGGKKTKEAAKAIAEAEVDELMNVATEIAEEGQLRKTTDEFGEEVWRGRVDPSNPVHRMLLDRSGIAAGSEAETKLVSLQDNIGKLTFIRKYASAEKKIGTEEAPLGFSKAQRTEEQAASTADQRAEKKADQTKVEGEFVEQDKSIIPLYQEVTSSGKIMVGGISPDKFVGNAKKIIDFLKEQKMDSGYADINDPQLVQDVQAYAKNHANGWKGDGSAPIKGADSNPEYTPNEIPKNRFDLLNAAFKYESSTNTARFNEKTAAYEAGKAAGKKGLRKPNLTEKQKAREAEAQGLAAMNEVPVTDRGEVNPLRDFINQSGKFTVTEQGKTRKGTQEILEDVIENVRPDLINGPIETTQSGQEGGLRGTEFKGDLSAMAGEGMPRGKFVAAGFMPDAQAKKTTAKALREKLEGEGYKFEVDKSSDGMEVIFRVEKDGKEAGRMSLYKQGNRIGYKEKYGEIGEVEVPPEHRGKGIAELMYREAGKELQRGGYTRLIGEVIAQAPMNLRKKVFGDFDYIGDIFKELSEDEAKARLPEVAELSKHQDRVSVGNKVNPRERFLPDTEPAPKYKSLWIDRSGKITGAMREQAHGELLKDIGKPETSLLRARVQGDTLHLDASPHQLTPSQRKIAQRFAEDHGLDIKTNDRKSSVRFMPDDPSDLSKMQEQPEPPKKTGREVINEAMARFDAGEIDRRELAKIIRDNSEHFMPDTPEFKKWFGDSKVVDKDGAPIVAYHGTNDTFTEFEHGRENRKDTGWLGRGFYFTDNPKVAGDYTALKRGDDAQIIPAFLKMENPYRASWDEKQKIMLAEMRGDKFAAQDRTNELIKKGHDGIILEIPGGSVEYVVFEPTQIKSAIGNSGAFDPENPDIRMMPDSGDLSAMKEDPSPKLSKIGKTGLAALSQTISPEEIEANGRKFTVGREAETGKFAKLMPEEEKPIGKRERAKNFKAWTGKAKVYRVGDDLHEITPGKPVVIEGFHGTTHDFTVADPNKANIENDFGKGFYITNEPGDVGENYAGEGPDLTSRIENLSERIENELYNMDAEEVAEQFGISQEDAELILGDHPYKSEEAERARKIKLDLARKQLVGHGGATMKVYAKLENPLVLGGKEESWEREYGDPDGEDYNEYDQPTGKLQEFINAIRSEASRYDDADPEGAIEQFEGYDSFTPSEAIKIVRENEGMSAAQDYDNDGGLAVSEIIRSALESMGYDGIVDRTVNEKFGSQRRMGKSMAGMDENTVHVIAFRPEQIKSATGNIGTFNPKNPDMNFMPDSGLYSQLERVAEQKIKGRATAEQILATLKNNGVKQDELDWVLGDFLREKAGQKISPEELREQIAANRLEVKEVRKGEDANELRAYQSKQAEFVDRIADINGQITEAMDGEITVRDLTGDKDLISKLNPEARKLWNERENVFNEKNQHSQEYDLSRGQTKFGTYQLPGGENYREFNYVLPSKGGDFQIKEDPNPPRSGVWMIVNNEGHTIARGFSTKTVARTEAERLGKAEPSYKVPSAHQYGDEADINRVFHARVNDRTTSDGTKLLFAEEIQSDWHQAGRKRGYSKPKGTHEMERKYKELEEKYRSARANIERLHREVMREGNEDKRAEYDKEYADYLTLGHEYRSAGLDLRGETNPSDGVPDAPFKGHGWKTLALKKLLAKAVEEGKDAIGWTSGEIQAERYDLSKQVDGIRLMRQEDGTYNIAGKQKQDGKWTSVASDIPQEKLADYIGKEMATKVDPGESVQDFTGQDLKVGGEGMKGFYDKELVNIANDLGKKYGAKVEKKKLGGYDEFSTDALTERELEEEDIENGQTGGYSMAVPEFLKDKEDYFDIATFEDGTVEINISGNVEYSQKNSLRGALEWLRDRYGKDSDTSKQIWSLPITPQLQKAIQAGQAMFMPEPSEKVKQTKFFHGTSSKESGEGILKSGVIRPGRDKDSRAHLAPIAGKTYATSSEETAAIYALGGVMMGHDYFGHKEVGTGFVFEIDPESIKDVIPDEDQVGELAVGALRGEVKGLEWLGRMAEQHATDRQLRRAMDGEYAYWSTIGKKLLKAMSDEMKMELIEKHKTHIAIDGEVKFLRAWAIPQNRSKEIAKDGSNLFEIGTKVYDRDTGMSLPEPKGKEPTEVQMQLFMPSTGSSPKVSKIEEGLQSMEVEDEDEDSLEVMSRNR